MPSPPIVAAWSILNKLHRNVPWISDNPLQKEIKKEFELSKTMAFRSVAWIAAKKT